MASRHLAVEPGAVEMGHAQVADDEVVRPVAELVERRQTVVRRLDAVVVVGEDLGQQRGQLGLVVHDQNRRAVSRARHRSSTMPFR
jgi:hypothetical protein